MMSKNRLFLGHYLGNENEWFLAWGETKMAAALYVDCSMGEPDLRSMREVVGPGYFGFRATIEQSEDGEPDDYVEFSNPTDVDCHPLFELCLGSGEGITENDAWIMRHLKEPLGDPVKRDVSPAAEALGLAQPELVREYTGHADLVEDEQTPPKRSWSR